MPGFRRISHDELERALKQGRRHYLVGHLETQQNALHIDDLRIEIGISRYTHAASEEPHYHTRATEYQYVLKGMTEYTDLRSNEIHSFRAGDFYAIDPETTYAQRIKRETEILFVKVPGGNDKHVVEAPASARQWMSAPLRARRIDHVNNTALHANSLRPAVAVAATNVQGQLLMLRRSDSGTWSMPGGTFEFGEDIPCCAQREFFEETGLKVTIKGVVGTYSNPRHLIEYSDGEIRQEFTIVLFGEIAEGTIKIDSESTEISWFSPREVMKLDLAESQRIRVEDFVSFMTNGKVAVR